MNNQPFLQAFTKVQQYEQTQSNTSSNPNNNIPSQESLDLLNQISKYYEDAIEQTNHEGALETLKFLRNHYETEAKFKQQLYQNQLAAMTTLSPLEKSSLLQSTFTIGHHKDAFPPTSAKPSAPSSTATAQQQQNVVNLREELYSLFVAPWELYYQNCLHSNGGVDEKTKRQYLETIQKSRISLGVLMQIAEDADKQSAKGSDLAQKLNSLNSNLHSIKLSRMELQLKDMERQLEEEKKQNLKVTRAYKKLKAKETTTNSNPP